MMSSFNFFMTPAQATAFRAAGLLSARHACHLAAKWLDAGSESVAVAALAIEDECYVAWADISMTFREALAESRVGAMTAGAEYALRVHALFGALQTGGVVSGDLHSLCDQLQFPDGASTFDLPGVCTKRIFSLAEEYDGYLGGDVFPDRELSVVSADLHCEVDRLRREIEELWPICSLDPDIPPLNENPGCPA
jgi:hypothetical protein